jgi:hypothetical protein
LIWLFLRLKPIQNCLESLPEKSIQKKKAFSAGKIECFARILHQIYKMKSIVLTYPGFQSLPRGIKKMLVASETHFFRQAKFSAASLVSAAGNFQGIIARWPRRKQGRFGWAQYDYPGSQN